MKKGLTGSTLKIIAICSMFTDHVAAVLLQPYLLQNGLIGVRDGMMTILEPDAMKNPLVLLFFVMRMVIGRWGFPIYCFLLVEGFIHTSNVKKYAIRLGGFALLSEIPFDLAQTGKLLNRESQNVFFTLFLGLIVLVAIEKIETMVKNVNLNYILRFLTVIAGAWVAMMLRTDYGKTYGIGVIAIAILYIYRRDKKRQIIAGCFAFLWEITAPFAFVPIAAYNGKRGMKMKYFFYAFYPLHLLALYLLSRAIYT